MNKTALIAVLLAGAPMSASAWGGGGGVAGQFDSYLFTLEWTPAFCEGRTSAAECANEQPDRFDVTHLSLHGLWPEKNGNGPYTSGVYYCGVGADEQSLDRGSTWCQLPVPAYSDATRAALTTVMPGVASCLDHHEWTKHGTCTGLAADDYFATAAALVQRIAGSAFGRYLTAHAGQTVDASAAFAAFEADFGAGSGGKLLLNCTEVRGSPALLEVNMHLSKPLRPASELSDMLLATGETGTCPASFLLDPVPSR